ncbi:MAG TPA: Na/Pi cotransporter family protein [Gammaproteobacteria bacterium]|nr:Na/Pi cotransporter family protein [Gammaproteobacteria bacterium]
MTTALVFLDLAGSIALLIWGVHMVQSGMERGYGPRLRRMLGAALGNRFTAALSGLGITALLQSSTATALMVASFTAGGLVDLTPALAVMLGANVGTTLIVQIFAFDISVVAPAFVLVGVLMYRRSASSRTREVGRVAIGLGLMLLALGHLLAIVRPYETMPNLRVVLGMLTNLWLLDVVVAALLTWAAHSSVAVVLVVMSFAANGAIPPETAFALILGANLGTAINPVFEGVPGRDPAAKRLPIGNLLNRVIGCLVALPFLAPIAHALTALEPDPARAAADFHTLFNLASAVVFFPLLPLYARLLKRVLAPRHREADLKQPLYLDPAARATPPLALAAATREALRMADALEAMLRSAREAFDRGDYSLIAETRRMDDVIDALNRAIKEYLAGLKPDELTADDDVRAMRILTFITNIEHAGDVLDGNVMMLAAKALNRGLMLSPPGREEIKAMLEKLTANVRSAAAVFVSEDLRAARRLVEEKVAFRDAEATATEAHFARLRAGRLDTAQTSTLHLDLIRDLKRINGHLVEAAAYPVLRAHGDLLPSRLKHGQ